MVGNPDGLAPTLSWDAQPPRAYGGRPLQDTKGRQPHPGGLRGACPLHQRTSPSPILKPPRGHGNTTRMTWKSVGRFTGDRQSLEEGAEA